MLRVHHTEERFRQRIASSHAVEQPRGADLRAHARSEVGDQQGESDDAEHRQPSAAGDVNEGGIDVRERLRRRPDQLRGVNLNRRQNANHQASQHRRQQNIAARVLRFFRERGDTVEADVSEYRDRRPSKDSFRVPQRRVIEGAGVESCAIVWVPEDVACRDHKENCNHHAHPRGQRRVHASRGFYSLDVQQRKRQRKEDSPRRVRYAGSKYMRLLAAPDGANDGIEHVVHHHAPAGDVTECGIDFLANVSEGRAGARISARHAAIADGGEQHRHHGDQDGGNDMPASAIAEHPEHRHRGDRLNHDNAVQNQIPERERAPQARNASGRVGGRTHSVSKNKTPLSCGDNGARGRVTRCSRGPNSDALPQFHKIPLEFYTEEIFRSMEKHLY